MLNEVLLPHKFDKSVAIKHPQNIQQEGMIKEVISLRYSQPKLICYYLCCFLSAGILYLLCRWMVKWTLFFQATQISPDKAQLFVVYGLDESETIVESERMLIDGKERVILKYRLYKYYFDGDSFQPIETNFTQLKNKELLDHHKNGVQTQQHYQDLVARFGLNETEIPDKGILRTLVDEVLTPFYIFQLSSVLLWFVTGYRNYATVILVTSVLSVVLALIESRSNFKRLQGLSKFSIPINVFRIERECIVLSSGKIELNEVIKSQAKRVDSFELVPGDVIEIEDNMIMPCDAILLNGQTIVNESMLTGESIPVLKSPLTYTNIIYNPSDEGKQSTLFAGTLSMETKIKNKGEIPVLAIVTETSFNTMKGSLIRSIMFPSSNSFSFYVDSIKFIGVMAIIAVMGFCCTVPNKLQDLLNGQITNWEFIGEGLDLLTIAVPPALPTCLQIGITIALSRLQKRSIFCISPSRVNICGKITVMCFDKTGTLTEEGLDLYGIRPVALITQQQNIKFQHVYYNCDELKIDGNVSFEELEMAQIDFKKEKLIPVKFIFDPQQASTIIEIMASCHGLAWVQGNLVGDPLEMKLFESTGYKLTESYDEGLLATLTPQEQPSTQEYQQNRMGICKRFEFSSKLQRMSVIVKNTDQNDKKYRVHVKGSPEKLRELCLKKSIPASFHQILDFYAQNGFRVLAVATKTIETDNVEQIEREDAESDLFFLGLIIMENKLKDVSTQIIEELHQANIRSIMVTGDNVLTAISVARQCGIIQQSQRVYLGELSEKKLQTGLYEVVWRDFEYSGNKLNPENLDLQNDQVEGIIEQDMEVVDDIKAERLTRQLTMIEGKFLPTEDDDTKNMKRNFSLLEEPPFKSVIRSRKQSNYLSRDLLKKFASSVRQESNDQKIPIWQNSVDDYVLAISGGAFNQLLQQNNIPLLEQLLLKTQVYARMRPEEKAILVQQLQQSSLKPLVGFCGDGANDCGALKGADMGVSLSLAEASVAAPFTSQIQDISCIPLILREGRAALTTSFNCFKFMALYSVIQFSQVTVLYLSSSNLTDNEFLYNDFSIFPLSMTLGFTLANPKLNKYVPGGSLISLPVLASVIGQAVIMIIFQLGMYFFLKAQSWFIDTHDANVNDDSDEAFQICYENTTLFLVGNFQYLAVSIAYAVGQPFRSEFYTNIWLMISIIGLLGVDLACLFIYGGWLDDLLGLRREVILNNEVLSKMPLTWMYIILIVAFLNALVVIFYERIIIARIERNSTKNQIQAK